VLDGADVFTQGSPDMTDGEGVGDRFSRGLGWGDFDTDGAADLVVGVAFESNSFTEPQHGMVHVMPGSPDGLSGTTEFGWYPDDFGMPRYWTPGLRLGYDLT
jgi:hypothetical protein